MDFNEYQRKATVTTAKFDRMKEELTCWSLCLCGEAGELANIVKKVVWHGHKMDIAKFEEELGDILWYLAATATCLGIDLDDVAAKNLAKLQQRYPNGFDVERSKNRVSK